MEPINVSIVLYNTQKDKLIKTMQSCLGNSKVAKLYLIDNSPADKLKELSHVDNRVVYIFTGKNLGYGKAHNIALRESLKQKIPYHLVLNPDIYFQPEVLDELYEFMEQNQDVGLVMPKVCFPDGSVQYLSKLLPTPLDLVGRRFLNWGPFKSLICRRNEIYELRFTGYDKIIDAPFLSGCFMFLRVSVLEKVGMFDERFFLYCDDLDLSRRINQVSRTVFYPYCEVFHEWGRGSYKSLKMLFYHIKDAIKYFNKWGWLIDKERKKTNEKTLKLNLKED